MKYRRDIDGLRTLAVVPVVLFHAGLGFPGGYVGVDIFFVISGYLITTILWDDLRSGSYSIVRFYERRIRRIFPALFAMLAVTAVFAVIYLLPPHLEEFGNSLLAATAFLSNVHFYLQEGYFNESSHIKPLLHTWSLAVEEQYYIFFPPLLALMFRFARPVAVWVILLALAVASFIGAVVTLGFDPSGAFYLPHLRAWELLMGSLTAIAVAQGWTAPLARWPLAMQAAALAAVAMILWSIFAYSPTTRFPGLAAVPPCLGTALLILTGRHCTTLVSRVLAISPFVFIGKVSYSFYLWHWPVIVFVAYRNVEPMGLGLGVFCVLLSFGLAVLSWKFVEEPFRRSRAIDRKRVFVTGAGMMTAAFAAGGIMVATGGLPNRLDPGLLALLDKDRFLQDRRECHMASPRRVALDNLCVRGDMSKPPSFALVGDSHADALSPGFFEAAEALGLSGYQYTRAGFRPLPGVTLIGSGDEKKQTKAFFTFLDKHPEVKVIFLTGYWLHQVTGSTYRYHGDVWIDDGYDGSGTAYNARAFRNGMDRLVEAYPDRKFVILDDVPSGETLDLRTAVRLILFRPDIAKQGLGIPTEEFLDQHAQYDALLAAIAADHPNVVYVPIFEALCGEDRCQLFNGKTPMFRDGDHLSPDGTRILLPELMQVLGEALPHSG